MDAQKYMGILKIPYALMGDISSLKNQLDISYHGLETLSGISVSTLKRLNNFAYAGEPNAKTQKIINDLQDLKGIKKYYKRSRKTQYSFRDREHLENYLEAHKFTLRQPQLKNISNTDYVRLNDLTNEYLDLQPSPTTEQIFGAKVNINYAIDDINRIITLANRNEFKLDSWYQLVIKADFLIDAVDKFLFKYARELLGDCNLSFKSAITLDEKFTIEYFRLIRSLTLAHPMGTTSFPNFGFTKETGQWLEDTRLSSSFIFGNEHSRSDVVLVLNKKDKPTYWHDVFLERDILWPVRIALSSLGTLSLVISKELEKTIQSLKNTKICLPATLNQRYFEVLLEETERRFPRRVERTEDNNGHKHIYWDLEQVYELITFLKANSNPRTNLFRSAVEKLVFDYKNALQNMQLNAGTWIASDNSFNLLHPNDQAIREVTGRDFLYQTGKINEYLSESDACSATASVHKLFTKGKAWMAEADWQVGANATNAEWAIVMLLEMKPILDKYYVISLRNRTDKEIYFQYLVAMYLISQGSAHDI